MTRELLKQYSDICLELETLEVNGLFPDRLDALRRQKQEVEAFVDSLPEPRQRLVVTLRALEGLSWQQVAGRVGYQYSVDHLRRIYSKAVNNL